MMDTILFNGRITTLHPAHLLATAVAIKDGVFAAVGADQEIMSRCQPKTAAIDLQGRTVELANVRECEDVRVRL
jgi:predicted amidohydrolase YtcJ